MKELTELERAKKKKNSEIKRR